MTSKLGEKSVSEDSSVALKELSRYLMTRSDKQQFLRYLQNKNAGEWSFVPLYCTKFDVGMDLTRKVDEDTLSRYVATYLNSPKYNKNKQVLVLFNVVDSPWNTVIFQEDIQETVNTGV